MEIISTVEEDSGVTGHLKWCKGSYLFAILAPRSLFSEDYVQHSLALELTLHSDLAHPLLIPLCFYWNGKA